MSLVLLASFHDVPREAWNRLAPSVFQTWEWQHTWWESFGRGKLLLFALRYQEKIEAIAPLFSDGGMIFLVGSGGSDYLDLLGRWNSDAMDDLIGAAISETPGFVGIRFYLVPDSSCTSKLLNTAAQRRAMQCWDEGDLPAPLLDLTFGERAAEKDSLRRRETWFSREGDLQIQTCRPTEDDLHAFFEQHVARWKGASQPSLFLEPQQRAFYQGIAARGSAAGWFRFMRIDWNGLPIAFHFGFHYRGEFLWYKPSFDVQLAKRSPGELLLRRLILQAMEEGATIFDFGIGDEPFKHRFATATRTVRTWGLYPS